MIETLKLIASRFNLGDERIAYKFNHSLRVANYCEAISNSIPLSKEDALIAYEIGLLHDIGRFTQLKETNSYDDKLFNHSESGIKMLFEDNEITKFNIDGSHYDLIKVGIKYHNEYSIPTDLGINEARFTKIIRDADKLDIITSCADGVMKFEPTKFDVTSKVKEEFFANQLIHKDNILNTSDKEAAIFAFVFDLNFKYSYEFLLKNDILKRVYKSFNNPKLRKYYKYALKYIKRRMKEC